MRRRAWIEAIKKHTVPVDHKEELFIKINDAPVERIKGVVRMNGKHDGNGTYFLEVYTQNTSERNGSRGETRPICFPTQFVDLSSEDYIVLYHQYRYNDEENSVSYIPWEQIMAIRYVSIEKIR
ncbi:MAG: hypothetical protein R6V55_03530 [Desulfovermiculus sp.]